MSELRSALDALAVEDLHPLSDGQVLDRVGLTPEAILGDGVTGDVLVIVTGDYGFVDAYGISPRIDRRGVAHGSGLGRDRWVVERGSAWLHSYMRLRTRWERRADFHLGLLQLACALICHRRLTAL